MYIERDMAPTLREAGSFFPVVSLTGPRQSGKSTLLQHCFPDYEYVNLEDLALREAAQSDPVGFLSDRSAPLIIDEAQHAPELFSQIQVEADRLGEPGRFFLSGSQNFLMLDQIQQSLAGRVGVLKLLPLSFAEVAPVRGIELDEYALQGGFPRRYQGSIRASLFYDSYLDTYVTRDVGEFLGVRNLRDFQRFLQMCAHYAGGALNMSAIARDLGISAPTVKEWLSILISSYTVFELPPFHANLGRRLVKTPKLYFTDTGLLCYLLGIRDAASLRDSDKRGAVYENLVVGDILKRYQNRGERPDLFYYRDDSRVEVDLLDYTDPAHPRAIEIKSGMSVKSGADRHLGTVGDKLGIPPEDRFLAYRGKETFRTKSGVAVISISDLLKVGGS